MFASGIHGSDQDAPPCKPIAATTATGTMDHVIARRTAHLRSRPGHAAINTAPTKGSSKSESNNMA